jgi:hypothetical protein
MSAIELSYICRLIAKELETAGDASDWIKKNALSKVLIRNEADKIIGAIITIEDYPIIEVNTLRRIITVSTNSKAAFKYEDRKGLNEAVKIYWGMDEVKPKIDIFI